MPTACVRYLTVLRMLDAHRADTYMLFHCTDH
jgi:hypothetical protein